MKTLILFLSIIFLINPLHAQRQYIEVNKKYPSVKIYQKGATTLSVKNLILLNDSVMQYNLSGSPDLIKTMNISSTKISYVSVKKGTHAGIGALCGGGLMLSSGLLAVMNVTSDPYYVDTGESYTGVVLGLTAGGAVIGAIVGACFPKWKVLYVPEKKTVYSFKLSPDFGRDYCGLGLKINF